MNSLKPVIFIITTVLITLTICPAGAIPIDQTADGVPEGLYQKTLPAGLVAQVHTLFPETDEVNPAYISLDIDPNLYLVQDAVITLTFIHEGAGYWNSFGYFLFDDNERILEKHLLFGNSSGRYSGGVLVPGDSIDFGASYNSDGSVNPFSAGTNIGFFVTPNGWGNPAFSKNEYSFYSLESLNPDGKRHAGTVYSNLHQALIIGIEDVWWDWSDKDCNDILFTLTTDPITALEEIVHQGNIAQTFQPVPEPSTLLLFAVGLISIAGFNRKKTS